MQQHAGPGVLTYDDDVRFAHVVADSAQAAAMPFYGHHRSANIAAVDQARAAAAQAVESAILQVMRRARPRDSVLVAASTPGGDREPQPAATGVSGLTPGSQGARCWLVQPVVEPDHLLRGVPLWATTLTLLDGPDVVAALACLPAVNRRWWAAKGSGAWTGRALSSATRCQVHPTQRLEQARLCCTDLTSWARTQRLGQLSQLSAHCASTHAYGSVWPYLLLAEGGLDVVAQPSAALCDVAAASLIASEAGAHVSDLTGRPGPAGGSALACVPALHDQVMAVLNLEVPA